MSQEVMIRSRPSSNIRESMDQPGFESERKLRDVAGQTPGEVLYRGQAGFRIRPGWSGLDPVDTYAECGRMMGLFMRNLFTGRVRTRNPLLIAWMAILGLLMLLSIALVLAGSLSGAHPLAGALGMLVCFVPPALFGSALLVCAARSLVVSRQE
jgi:hypothetical protein